MARGIQYKLTGLEERGIVMPYHYKPAPIDYSTGATPYDTSTIPRRVSNKTILDGTSRFRVGFEIEKVALDREAVREYELFCGFERDSSCGYEAVTHILPLVPDSKWRSKVFDMMKNASRIIDDKYSPSDVRCGGHINISVQFESPIDVIRKIRPYMGIMYSLYRFRLINKACRGDLFMTPWNPRGLHVEHPKYSILRNVNDDYVEIRLPNRVTSVSQLMLRYELIYEILYAAFDSVNYSFTRKITPIISKMYGGDKDRVREVMRLAQQFQKMIDTETINEYVKQFVDPQSELVAYYDEQTKEQFLHIYEENNESVHPF